MPVKRDLTDRFLKAIKPAEPGKRPIFWDAQVPQFGIRVTEKSTKENIGAFVLVGAVPGKPESSAASDRRLSRRRLWRKARQIAREWREDIAKGVDPKVKEAERRRAEDRRRADTFAAVIRGISRNNDCRH